MRSAASRWDDAGQRQCRRRSRHWARDSDTGRGLQRHGATAHRRDQDRPHGRVRRRDQRQPEFDTQVITLDGDQRHRPRRRERYRLFNNDNFTSAAQPAFSINAPEGQTVTVSVNGAVRSRPSKVPPGVYRVTLPPGTLQVGRTRLARPVSDKNPTTTLAPLIVVLRPDGQDGLCRAGGGGFIAERGVHSGKCESSFASEAGFFAVDDAEGPNRHAPARRRRLRRGRGWAGVRSSSRRRRHRNRRDAQPHRRATSVSI